MAEHKQSDNVQKTQPKTEQHESSNLTDAVQKIWQGPADGSQPGCVVDSGNQPTMTKEDLAEAMKIVTDAQGKEHLEFTPAGDIFKNTSDSQTAHPKEAGRHNIENAVKIENNIAKLPEKQQQNVLDGINGVRDHDPKKIEEFLKHATTAEMDAFKKSLQDIGYKVDEEGPSPEELARIGGPTHKYITISDPNSLLPSGIKITETRNPSTGPMDTPSYQIGFEK